YFLPGPAAAPATRVLPPGVPGSTRATMNEDRLSSSHHLDHGRTEELRRRLRHVEGRTVEAIHSHPCRYGTSRRLQILVSERGCVCRCRKCISRRLLVADDKKYF